jgi:hypothetical protein
MTVAADSIADDYGRARKAEGRMENSTQLMNTMSMK